MKLQKNDDYINVRINRATHAQVAELAHALRIGIGEALMLLVSNGRKNLMEHYIERLEQRKAKIIKLLSE